MTEFEKREYFECKVDGQKIFGVLHRPAKVEPYPLVLFCHGFGGQKVGHARLGVRLSESLSKAGIASLRIDCRGSGDSEGSFEKMTVESQVLDCLTSLEKLSKDPHIDQKRLGFFGRSFGGAVAVITAARHGNMKAGVLWAPFFHAKQWENQWEELINAPLTEDEKMTRMAIHGQVPGMEFYRQFFSLKIEEPLKKLHGADILHIWGSQDAIINEGHTLEYEIIRKASNGKSSFIRLKESDHHFTNVIEQEIALENSTKWYVDNLLNRKDRH